MAAFTHNRPSTRLYTPSRGRVQEVEQAVNTLVNNVLSIELRFALQVLLVLFLNIFKERHPAASSVE